MRLAYVNSFLLVLCIVALCKVRISSALVTGISVAGTEGDSPTSVAHGNSSNVRVSSEPEEPITQDPTSPSAEEMISESTASDRSTSQSSSSQPSTAIQQEPVGRNSQLSSTLQQDPGGSNSQLPSTLQQGPGGRNSQLSSTLQQDPGGSNSQLPSTLQQGPDGSNAQLPTAIQQEPDHMNSIESSFLVLNYTVEKQLRIEAIKQDILNRLGMTRAPDVSRVNMTVQERRQILRLYKKSMEELHGKTASSLFFDDDQFYANQFHSFTEYGNKPAPVSDRLWRSTRGKRIFFAVDIPEPADPRKETIVKSATLKLYKRDVRPQNLAVSDVIDRSVRIEIYQILQLTTGKFLRRSIDSRLLSLDKAAWEEFDVSRAVQDWIRDPSSNLGLEISCDIRYRMEDLLDFVVWSPAVADNAYQSGLLPILNVLTQEKRILGRQKRNLPERRDCVQGDGEERCCRYPLTVRFRDIGWADWVIEPESYQAYYCSGSCPANYRVAHRYTSIKTMIRERHPSTPLSVGCGVTRLGNLNIAHYNQDRVLVVSVFESMFALECMCV